MARAMEHSLVGPNGISKRVGSAIAEDDLLFSVKEVGRRRSCCITMPLRPSLYSDCR